MEPNVKTLLSTRVKFSKHCVSRDGTQRRIFLIIILRINTFIVQVYLQETVYIVQKAAFTTFYCFAKLIIFHSTWGRTKSAYCLLKDFPPPLIMLRKQFSLFKRK